MLAVGPQVLETTLSALNSPPQGSAAFRGGEAYQRATELLEPAPSIGYKVVDGNRYSQIMRKWLLALLKQVKELENAGHDDAEEASKEVWIELAKKLMPTDDEIKDIMGVVASRWEVNENGLLLEAVQEMPPPDER